MRRAACWLALGALLMGCAEARRPAVPEPAGELSAGRVVAPLTAILDLALRDYSGTGLPEGQPAAAALAAARVEWLSGETRAGYRLGNLPASHRFALLRAVEESRADLAISPEATPEQVVQALVAVARALNQGDEAEAATTLEEPVFLRVRPDARARLDQPGPRPGTALALSSLQEELNRQREQGRAGLDGTAGAEPVGVMIWMGLMGPAL